MGRLEGEIVGDGGYWFLNDVHFVQVDGVPEVCFQAGGGLVEYRIGVLLRVQVQNGNGPTALPITFQL